GTALYLGNAERTTTIGRNRIQGNFAYGIRLQRLGYLGASRSRVDVKENVLSGCDRGLVIDSLYPLLPGDASFEGNNFYDNGIGFQVVAASAARFDASTFTVRNNNFRGNGDGAFINGSAVTVTARGNWWGHETGPFDPSGNPSGQGDAVSSGVDYASWLENAYAPGADDGGGGCDLGFSPLLVSLVIPLILLRRR
ncbi:MAG: right-handed parallel beta-helix repeat-containing protein, partial [Synergistales bacterium]|nr:right-handed parallel beta-helix repeat-containing protein [Synergistales bacterium]